ncbi:cap-gly domain-containing linker protein 1 isoform x5, partial [Lasius niger]
PSCADSILSTKQVNIDVQVERNVFEGFTSGPQQLSGVKCTDEHMEVEIARPPAASAVVTPTITKLGKGEVGHTSTGQNSQIDDINLRIRDLVRRKRELKREAELEKSEAGSGGPSYNSEKPLPQRVPKPRPKIISNTQIVPLRSNVKKVEFSDGNRTDSSRQEWTEVLNNNKKGKGRGKLNKKATVPSYK